MLGRMKREDIEQLATLARIELSEQEISRLPDELSAIVSYVSTVSDIAADDVDAAPQVGARHNVFRTDEVTNEPDEYTSDILAEMPETDDRSLVVKKILQTDE